VRRIHHIYVAGPLTKGDPFLNVRAALLAGDLLRRAGFAPYVPHEHVLWQMVTGTVEYEAAMSLDLAWVTRCDALLRLPGESSGADREVEHARKLGLPVYTDIDELLRNPAAIEMADGCGCARTA
jgi:nucleoside 2-deoxyribosyltransferase